MTIVVTCSKCGTAYTVDREAIFKGTWRLACPRCHLPPPPDDPTGEAPEDDDTGRGPPDGAACP